MKWRKEHELIGIDEVMTEENTHKKASTTKKIQFQRMVR